MRIKDISLENRPMERLEKLGPSVLSDAELLAVILKTGNKKENVIDMSNRLISKYGFDKLSMCTLSELQEINGIGRTKSCQIIALFELNKRHSYAKTNGVPIKTAKDVFSHCSPKLSGLDREFFMILHLDSKHRILKDEVVSVKKTTDTAKTLIKKSEPIFDKPLDQKGRLKEKIIQDIDKVELIVAEEKENLMNLLLDIQEKEHYLPKDKLLTLSKTKHIPGVEIYGVATFYAQFKLDKPGKYKLSLCRGTACHVKNSAAIIEYIQEYLGIKVGQTTEDGKFTLETVNCIGACAKAPAMMINGAVHGELTKDKVKKLIDALKKE